ncbi:uncharacterized protein [Antedon mediterranea]|uniref:uncharacterized protein n=1 Tax=Antedon mediterranea TaxID=105859 RepID=UPI003AF9BEDC
MFAMEVDFVGSAHPTTEQIQASSNENASSLFKTNQSDDTVLIKEELLDASTCGFQGGNNNRKITHMHTDEMNQSTEKAFASNQAQVLPTCSLPNQSMLNTSQTRRDMFQASGCLTQHSSNGLAQQGNSPFNISILPPISSISSSVLGPSQCQTSTVSSIAGYGDSQVPGYARKSLSRFNNIQMRYSFTPEQKMILHKHFESGMTGQSLAFQGKIMECALEAGVEFDVVRNWIGNMRRKERMAAAQQAYMENRASTLAGNPSMVATSIPGMPPPKVPRMDILPPQSISMLHRPPTATYPNQPGVVPPASQIRPVGMVPLHSLSVVSGSSQPEKASVTPGQPGWLGEGSVNAMMNDARNGHQPSHPPVMSANDQKQMHVQAVIEAIKSHMQILQTMGCECVMAAVTPFENKALIDNRTLITGTTKGVQYFAQIQKIQPFAEFVKAEAMFGSDDDDLSIGNESLSDDFDDVSVNLQQQQQPKTITVDSNNGQTSSDSNASNSKSNEEKKSASVSSEDTEVKLTNGQIIHAGEEVLIVTKDHHIIGNGFLLPSPHKKIKLKSDGN